MTNKELYDAILKWGDDNSIDSDVFYEMNLVDLLNLLEEED